MNTADNITRLIGNTPLVKINKLARGLQASIYAKLEFYNPCGSVKDRIALSMIEDAEQKGLLNNQTTIIEPTSGNTGIGLAFVCAYKGYKLILVMPENMSPERRKLASLLGAELVLTSPDKGMKGAVDKAKALVENTPDSYMPQQFENRANPYIHKITTAEEIWRDTEGKVDIIVAGVGTGGTITGIAENIKEKKKDFKVIAVEPEESAVLSGKKPAPHTIQGIGAGFIPKILRKDLIDEIIKVSGQAAKEFTVRLASQEGILAGVSSGAAVAAAIEVGKRPQNKDKLIVVIFPDTAERYLSLY